MPDSKTHEPFRPPGAGAGKVIEEGISMAQAGGPEKTDSSRFSAVNEIVWLVGGSAVAGLVLTLAVVLVRKLLAI